MTRQSFEIFHDPADIRDTWLSLERSGAHTPYQRFDLLSPWLRHVGAAKGAVTAITVVRDMAGTPLALFPFCTMPLGPLRILRFAGGKHANFNMGLFAPGAVSSLDRSALRGMLRAAGIATGAHLAVLENQPLQWEGFDNPLAALPNRPSPEPAYKLALTDTFENLISSRISKDARQKLRRKERRLGELAPVSYEQARTEPAVRAALEAFFAQKASRFRQLGQPDVFAEPGVRDFLVEASLSGLEGGRPGIRIYTCAAGERIVATYGAAVSAERFCGMFTAFDNAEDVFRWSPGDLLLFNLVQMMHAAGLHTFDLGVGEAKYKESYCNEAEALFDTILPLSSAGGAAALAYGAALAAKQRIKRSPRLLAALNRLRAARLG